MPAYAYVNDGVVLEIFQPYINEEGVEVPITERFHPDFVALFVEVTEQTGTPQQNWIYEDGVFKKPPPYVPTDAEVLAMQSATLVRLKVEAEAQKTALTNRIGTLQDAIDNVGVEGMEDFAATPEEQIEFPKRKAQLTKWKNYAILLGRVTSQAGWPPEVVWPVKPAEGMDLSTNYAIAPESI